MGRGWTWHDGATEEQMEDAKNAGEIKALVDRWNALDRQMETELFQRQAEEEDGLNREFDNDEEEAEYQMSMQLRRDAQAKELEELETKLHERGARIMRAYEHWNEEEHLVEYLETRYDNYY